MMSFEFNQISILAILFLTIHSAAGFLLYSTVFHVLTLVARSCSLQLLLIYLFYSLIVFTSLVLF